MLERERESFGLVGLSWLRLDGLNGVCFSGSRGEWTILEFDLEGIVSAGGFFTLHLITDVSGSNCYCGVWIMTKTSLVIFSLTRKAGGNVCERYMRRGIFCHKVGI